MYQKYISKYNINIYNKKCTLLQMKTRLHIYVITEFLKKSNVKGGKSMIQNGTHEVRGQPRHIWMGKSLSVAAYYRNGKKTQNVCKHCKAVFKLNKLVQFQPIFFFLLLLCKNELLTLENKKTKFLITVEQLNKCIKIAVHCIHPTLEKKLVNLNAILIIKKYYFYVFIFYYFNQIEVCFTFISSFH